MQVLWLLDMKGIPIHCSKSSENFAIFHYRIFSTTVLKTKTTCQNKGGKLHITLKKLYILYLLYLLTLILTLSPGRLLNLILKTLNQAMFSCKTTVYVLPHLHL